MTAITDAEARARLAWIKATANQAASMYEFGLHFGPTPTANVEDDHRPRMERVIDDGARDRRRCDMFERAGHDVWRDIFAGE